MFASIVWVESIKAVRDVSHEAIDHKPIGPQARALFSIGWGSDVSGPVPSLCGKPRPILGWRSLPRRLVSWECGQMVTEVWICWTGLRRTRLGRVPERDPVGLWLQQGRQDQQERADYDFAGFGQTLDGVDHWRAVEPPIDSFNRNSIIYSNNYINLKVYNRSESLQLRAIGAKDRLLCQFLTQ